MADLALQRAFLAACFDDDDGGARAASLPALLERAGVGEEDRRALMAERPRLWLYRQLVRNNVTDVTGRMMPRARARMNDLAGGAFDRAMSAFMRERGPRTHHLRDVPMELLEFSAPRWEADPRIPPYAVDLARYELLEFSLGVSLARPRAESPGEVVVDRPLVFTDVKALLPLAHAVHRLPEALEDRTVPDAIATTLLGYRDASHVVRFLELTPLAARILSRLFDCEPLATALPAACEAEGTTLGPEILESTAALLADLAERGVFLGASP